ncbi:MAG: hypothetical protein OEU26_27915, partial [Candidatus Tectomicrobia bacterium]|nr:hypothetical protein [Candidatus Tectomicrobia bacterium]
CERGLISAANRRLSLHEEDIAKRFRVPSNALAELVDQHLLRAEPRDTGVYYELSHDTLVEPVRESQRRRTATMFKSGGVLLGALLITGIFFLWPAAQHPADQAYRQAVQYSLDGKFGQAVAAFQQAIRYDNQNVESYSKR